MTMGDHLLIDDKLIGTDTLTKGLIYLINHSTIYTGNHQLE